MPRSDVAPRFLRMTGRALQSRWMLLVLLVPVIVIAIAAAMLIWPINYAEGPYRPDPFRKYATPSSLTSLLKADFIAGQSVYLNDIQLVPGAKENQYIAHGAEGNAMLVISTGQASPLPKTPAVVDVQGVIRPLPSVNTLKRVWKLKGQQLEAVSGGKYYVSAQRIHVESHSRAHN